MLKCKMTRANLEFAKLRSGLEPKPRVFLFCPLCVEGKEKSHSEQDTRVSRVVPGVGQVGRHRSPRTGQPQCGAVRPCSTESHALTWGETSLVHPLGYHVYHLLGGGEGGQRKGTEGCRKTEN